jgi:hypothetical protein
MVMVTGAGPQSKVITPPAATAATTASDVQLAGVPFPTTRSGRLTSTALASPGTVACPSGLPGLGRICGGFGLAELGVGDVRGGVGTEMEGVEVGCEGSGTVAVGVEATEPGC